MGAEYELKFRAETDIQESVYTTFPAHWQTVSMQTPNPINEANI